jgi:hypothetical protein
MLIDQNGNVGIGTTNPTALLHISGSSYPNVRVETMSTTGDAYFRVMNTGGYMGDFMLNGTAETTFGGPNSLNIVNNTTAPITFYNNGQERMRIDATGNVGIGTITPNAAKGPDGYLDVKDVYLRDSGKWASSGGSSCTWRTAFDASGNGQLSCNIGEIAVAGGCRQNGAIGGIRSSNPWPNDCTGNTCTGWYCLQSDAVSQFISVRCCTP